MATKILLKRSNTSGSVPLTGDLDQGELAVNLADRKLYTKNGSGAIVTVNGAYVDSVAPTTPLEGDLWYDTATNYLKAYNGSAWVNAGFTTLGEFGITATAAELNYVDGVTSNIQTQLDSKSSTSHNHTLDGLSNTTITSNTAGEILKWNGSAWVNNTLAEAGIATSSHNHTLDSLSNTTITSNTAGEILKWNGTAWVNNTLAEAGIQPAGSYAAASHTHAISDVIGLQTELDGKSPTGHTHLLADVTDVTATAAELNVLDGITATTTELNYTDGVTSNIQTQLNGKASTSHNHTLDGLSNTTITSNTAGEILKWNGTAWVNNTLAEAGIQPAGAYLTAESDTLATVTGRGATTGTAISITNATASTSTTTGALKVTGGVGVGGNLNVGGNTIITGNLTVNGTTTTVNSNTVNIGDNIIVLNADETGTPSQNAGFEVERGTSANVAFLWDESTDAWDFGSYPVQNVVIDGGSY